jgi:hypothetical protein
MVARTVWVAMAGVCVLGGVGGRVQPRRTSFKVDAAGYFRKVTSTTGESDRSQTELQVLSDIPFCNLVGCERAFS